MTTSTPPPLYHHRPFLQALLEIVRSLSGHGPARDPLISAGAVPRLLRLLVPAIPLSLANPAAAALATMARDPTCAEALLKAQALPALVQVMIYMLCLPPTIPPLPP